MCVCECICMCVYMPVHEAKEGHQMLSSTNLCIFFLRQGLSLNLGLAFSQLCWRSSNYPPVPTLSVNEASHA